MRRSSHSRSRSRSRWRNRRRSPSSSQSSGGEGRVSREISVPECFVGEIIGRNRQNLARLSQSYGVVTDVAQACEPDLAKIFVPRKRLTFTGSRTRARARAHRRAARPATAGDVRARARAHRRAAGAATATTRRSQARRGSRERTPPRPPQLRLCRQVSSSGRRGAISSPPRRRRRSRPRRPPTPTARSSRIL